MSLSGTHIKKEPFCPKGSPKLFFCVICSFLYIFDLSAFVVGGRTETMHKKRTFYTYANPYKKPPICEKYGENSLFHTSNTYELC